MRNILLLTILIAIFSIEADGQDIIHTLDNYRIRASVRSISDRLITYTDFEQKDSPLKRVERSKIRFIEFEKGYVLYGDELANTAKYYSTNRTWVIKYNLYASAIEALQLSLEKAINPYSSIETDVYLFELGFDHSRRSSGLGIALAYKVKIPFLFEKELYRPVHLLNGPYFRVKGAYFSRKYEDKDEYDPIQGLLSIGCDLGKQWIIKNKVALDCYIGAHKSFGGTSNRDFFGDYFGQEGYLISVGLKIGLLLGSDRGLGI